MLLKIVGKVYLSDGRTDSRGGNSTCIKLLFQLDHLILCEIGDVFAVYKAKLNVIDAVEMESGYLTLNRRSAFVGKG